LGSILDLLPCEGALFTGRAGALPLRSGGVLLVTPGFDRVVTSADEPADNAILAPDESLPVRRPGYLNTSPLVPRSSEWPSAGEGTIRSTFQALWKKRDKPDVYIRQDPYTGAMIRVAQALRNQLGAVALSYVIEVGETHDAEVAYQLLKAVQGMADAATMFDVPFLAGDLREDASIGLWPALTVFAHSDKPSNAAPQGAVVTLLGRMTDDLSGSLFVDGAEGFPPPIDLVIEGRVQEIARAFGGGMPLGRGGLLLTLARCCARAGLGAHLTLPDAWRSLTLPAMLFGEAQSRFLLFLPHDRVTELQAMAELLSIPVAVLGKTGGPTLTLDGIIDLEVRELK
jgi:phosphoribosylformylglycinamidine (FGAM) synthase-like enzyme